MLYFYVKRNASADASDENGGVRAMNKITIRGKSYYRLSMHPEIDDLDRGELSVESLKKKTNLLFEIHTCDRLLTSKKYFPLAGKVLSSRMDDKRMRTRYDTTTEKLYEDVYAWYAMTNTMGLYWLIIRNVPKAVENFALAAVYELCFVSVIDPFVLTKNYVKSEMTAYANLSALSKRKLSPLAIHEKALVILDQALSDNLDTAEALRTAGKKLLAAVS